MLLHVNNRFKGAVACLHQDGGIAVIMFCHHIVGSITGLIRGRGGTGGGGGGGLINGILR